MSYHRLLLNHLSRRKFLAGSAQAGALAALPALAGCATGGSSVSKPVPGTLRLGVAGGSHTDSFDVRTYTDSVAIVLGYQVMNGFVEIDANRQVVPELFESWDVKPGAREWSFKLRQGVTFHNGKSFTTADAIYSLNLHRNSSASSAAGALKNILDIKADGMDRVSIMLAEGDADFLYVLSDYHLLVVPADFDDWSHPIGTGAFKFEMYEPGSRAATTRQANYWKQGVGNVQAVETIVINDSNSRFDALRSDQVDVINRVPEAVAASLTGDGSMQLVRASGGYHVDYAMNVADSPFDNPDLRLALKYAIDRDTIVKELFSGYGHVGNDHPIPTSDPFYNSELTQRRYDPDKARFHLKKSGLENTKIVLSASDAAYKGAIDTAFLFQAAAAKADIPLMIKKEPEYGFWDDVWMKAPFFVGYWGGRPAATQMLSVAYKSSAAWNETNWRRADFDVLLTSAKTEIDVTKRRDYIWQMQAMLSQEGGAIIPAFKEWLDAHRPRVQNHTPHSVFDLCNGRIAEKVSLTG